jgi:hypothetical protein
MSKPDKRLLFFVLALLLMTAYFSCTQPDDVFTDIGQTTLNLEVERLPTPPANMVYELWVSKDQVHSMDVSGDGLVSLGKFSFLKSDTAGDVFLNLNGTPREKGSEFVLPGDLFAYRSMFVTVEQNPDPIPADPGPIMLIGNIVPVEDIMPTLNFPLSNELWNAIVRFNVEAVSDDNRAANDGAGIWFSSYRTALDSITDTLGIDTTIWDTIVIPPEVDTIINGDETTYDTNYDSLYKPRLFTLENIEVKTLQVVPQTDTLVLGPPVMRTRVDFDEIKKIDSTPPFTFRDLSANPYTTGGTYGVIYDIFTQDDFGLPNYLDWGWKYQGWIVTPYFNDSLSLTAGEFTPPAWSYKSDLVNWFPGDTGRLFTTGTFSRIDTIDDADPFTFELVEGDLWLYDTQFETIMASVETTIDSQLVTKYKRPYYPGEDFLNTDSLQVYYGISSVNFMPSAYSGRIEGTVFISMEPINRLTDTTNFPLIVFSGRLPASMTLLNELGRVVDMLGRHSTVPGQTEGFPEIKVKFNRL